MNLIKYMRVGATLLAMVASVSPICAMQPGQYGPNGPYYGPNATGTPHQTYGSYTQQPYWGSSSDESLLGTFTNWVTGATRKINETANTVRQKRSEVNQNSPTNATANLTGELKAAQVEVKSSMTALEEAGSAFRGFFGMLPTPWSIGAAVAGYNDSRRKEVSRGDTGGFESEQGGQSTWIQAGKDRWVPDGKATAGDLFKADVMKKVKDDVVPFFMKDNKPDAIKIGGAAITALLTAAVFKEEITGAVKSIARKLLPKRFFEDKPANGGILFSDLSPEQQKHVQKQMGIMGTAPQSRYSYPVSGQQNAFQYNLNAKASELYQKGWFGYSRKR